MTDIVSNFKSLDIPGKKTPVIDFDNLHFEEFTIGSFDLTVKDGEGVEVSLQDMTNKIAAVPFCIHVPKQCCGSAWASATGQSYTGINAIVLNATGYGQMVTTTPPGGFNVGDLAVHHQMDNVACEALADVAGLIDSTIIALVSKAMELTFPKVIAKVYDTPANLVLGALEHPPALGWGGEKFRLDNSFVSVDYSDHMLTHFHKGEFKSTANPKESQQIPPPLDVPKNKDVAIGFSDYTLNTLFEAVKDEHMFESQFELPIHTPSILKICDGCPVEVSVTFEQRAEVEFLDGHATNKLHGMKFELGAKTDTKVVPLFTVTVDAAASMAFELRQPTGKAPDLKATLSLDSFEQRELIFYAGKINTDDLNRDIRAVLTFLMTKINKAVPALPLLSLPGVKYENPSLDIGRDQNRLLVFAADLVRAGDATQILI